MHLTTNKLVDIEKSWIRGLKEAWRASAGRLHLRSRRVFSLTLLGTLLTGTLASSMLGHGVHAQDRQAKQGASVDSRDAVPLAVPGRADLPTPFSKIAKEVGPAVVNINTEILPRAGARRKGQADEGDDGNGGDDSQSQGPGDGGMQDFFNHFFGGAPGMGGQDPQEQEQRALGSGFIVDPHGYIVTNDHVIDRADRIYVKLTTDPANDQGHRATVIGFDKETDLAVIKIDVGSLLPTVKLGNSDGAQVGDWVEAIGSPFDLAQTVTAGIVSAKNRNIVGGVGGQFKHFIQTDAAINPGNSGGPLLNMESQVIGVNTAYFTQSNGYMGIGFAMPSNTVVDVYNQLIGPNHRVTRGSLGIHYQADINSAVAKIYGASTGVLISAVTPGRAADIAGLKVNDVIVSVDGRPVSNGDDLVDTIAPRHPGSKVIVGYLRNGEKLTTTCTIEDRADIANAASGRAEETVPGGPVPNPGKAKLGITVSDLPSGAPSGLHGVLIRAVVPGSFADELDPAVGPGIVIEGINRRAVSNKQQFDAIVSGLKSGDDVVLQVAYPNSGGQTTLTGGQIP